MPTFQQDVDQCAVGTDVLVLEDGRRRLAVSPGLQGRVLTSSMDGGEGMSLGWVNARYIASGKKHPEFNPYGGADRVWIAPEAGQFGFHFDPGAPFDLKHAHVPAPLDREPFHVESRDKRSITLQKDLDLVNHSGTKLQMRLDRKVSLLGEEETFVDLGMGHDGLQWVGFESSNTLLNRGHLPWKKETGLAAVWIIGMFPATDRSTVILPVKEGPAAPGEKVVIPVFGELPPDRLRLLPNAALFKGDSKYRSKVALHARRAKGVLGSWDPVSGVLTVVSINLPQGPHAYVNSMWEIQKEPYAGDVVSSYNDGPAEPGGESWGAYYEMETVSPAAELAPGGTLTHIHRTFHFKGERAHLDIMSKRLLGVSLADVEAFADNF